MSRHSSPDLGLTEKNMAFARSVVLDVKRDKIMGDHYREIFGGNIQDMRYGRDYPTWAAFDLVLAGNYVDVSTKCHIFQHFNIPTVPVLYAGLWNDDLLKLADGPTTLCKPEDIKEPFKGREGIVITAYGPIRKIARAVSVDYHARANRNQTEEH